MRIVISGCSGGGKSTLLSMMESHGFHVFTEPGREIVKDQLSCGGTGLPWTDLEQFAELCISKSIENYCLANLASCPAIYDRSYIDALSALEYIASPKLSKYSSLTRKYRYHKNAYFTPPWEEIFTTDKERRHSYADSVDEYSRLVESYDRYGYKIIELPKTDRVTRLEFLKKSIDIDKGKLR